MSLKSRPDHIHFSRPRYPCKYFLCPKFTDLHVGILGGLDATFEVDALVLVALDVVEVRHEHG